MRGLSDDQIAQRRLGIGGSDAGEIMAGRWRDLWLIKTGRAQPEDLSDVLPVQIGIVTEELNAQWYARKTGRPVLRRGEHVVSRKYPWMRANLDAVTTTVAGGRPAYLDFKHVGRFDEAALLRYTPQGVHCCIILGCDHWLLSAFVGNSKWEITGDQEADPFYREELIAKEREFWNFVERDEEPRDRAEPALAPKPEKRLRNIHMPTFTEPGWVDFAQRNNWAIDAANEIMTFGETEGAHKAHMAARERLKLLVPDDAGELRRADFLFTRAKNGAVTMKVEKKDG